MGAVPGTGSAAQHSAWVPHEDGLWHGACPSAAGPGAATAPRCCWHRATVCWD